MFQYYIVSALLFIEITFLICLLFPLPAFAVGAVLSAMNRMRHVIRFTAVALLFFYS